LKKTELTRGQSPLGARIVNHQSRRLRQGLCLLARSVQNGSRPGRKPYATMRGRILRELCAPTRTSALALQHTKKGTPSAMSSPSVSKNFLRRHPQPGQNEILPASSNLAGCHAELRAAPASGLAPLPLLVRIPHPRYWLGRCQKRERKRNHREEKMAIEELRKNGKHTVTFTCPCRPPARLVGAYLLAVAMQRHLLSQR